MNDPAAKRRGHGESQVAGQMRRYLDLESPDGRARKTRIAAALFPSEAHRPVAHLWPALLLGSFPLQGAGQVSLSRENNGLDGIPVLEWMASHGPAFPFATPRDRRVVAQREVFFVRGPGSPGPDVPQGEAPAVTARATPRWPGGSGRAPRQLQIDTGENPAKW